MKKALIVDNDTANYNHLATLLEAHYCKATYADSIKQAKSFNLNTFDLLISEMALGDGTATELLGSCNCPVLILDEANNGKALVEAMRMGATDCLTKPFTDNYNASAPATASPATLARSSTGTKSGKAS